jgi:hypothetical protein
LVVVHASLLELQPGRNFARRYEFQKTRNERPHFLVQPSGWRNNGRLSKMPVDRKSGTGSGGAANKPRYHSIDTVISVEQEIPMLNSTCANVLIGN